MAPFNVIQNGCVKGYMPVLQPNLRGGERGRVQV